MQVFTSLHEGIDRRGRKKSKREPEMMMKSWKLAGFDTFDGHFYKIEGAYETEEDAIRAAQERLIELEELQPTSTRQGNHPLVFRIWCMWCGLMVPCTALEQPKKRSVHTQKFSAHLNNDYLSIKPFPVAASKKGFHLSIRQTSAREKRKGKIWIWKEP